jgi:hypothetical protein
MNDKIKLALKIDTCFVLILSSVLLSLVPFGLLITRYDFQNVFYLVPLLGFIIGILWSRKVIKAGNYNDYDPMALHKTPDLIETWEKEEIRNKKNEEKYENEHDLKT